VLVLGSEIHDLKFKQLNYSINAVAESFQIFSLLGLKKPAKFFGIILKLTDGKVKHDPLVQLDPQFNTNMLQQMLPPNIHLSEFTIEVKVGKNL
jgi:hypothetical protein